MRYLISFFGKDDMEPRYTRLAIKEMEPRYTRLAIKEQAIRHAQTLTNAGYFNVELFDTCTGTKLEF